MSVRLLSLQVTRPAFPHPPPLTTTMRRLKPPLPWQCHEQKEKKKQKKQPTIYSVCLLPLDLRRLTKGLMWIHMHELTRMCRLNSCCLSPTKSHLCDDELTAGRTSQRILILQFIGMKLSIKWFCTPCVFTLRGLPQRLLFSFLYDPSIELEYHTSAPVDAASGPV